MNSKGMDKRTFIIVAIVLAIVVFFVTLAIVGNRRGDGTTVSVAAPEGTTVYVGTTDEEDSFAPVETLEINNPPLTVDTDPGEVSFIATRGEGFYPWEKTLVLTEGDETQVFPLMLPQEPELEPVDDASVAEAFSVIATLPTQENPLVASEEGLTAYVESGAVVVEWTGAVEDMPEFFCPGENVADCLVQQVLTFDAAGPVENLEFFGEENQFLMIDRGAVIGVIEIDRRDIQNYQPLYIGTMPAFRHVDGNVYVKDQSETWRVALPAYTG